MKKIDVTQPYAMTSPFADGVYSSVSTSDFEIPADTSTAPDDTCVIDDGFLPITSTDLDDGGIAPERKNFNGMFYLSTDQRFFLQNGGFITYNSNVATAIGGYPQDAILGFIDSQGTYKLVKSLIDDNTNDFTQDETLIDGEHWEEIAMGGSGSGYQMFDIVMKDHVLSYEESLGLAPLGTYVYKEAIAGTRYGYPDFYQKCIDEYTNASAITVNEYLNSNISPIGSLVDNAGVISGFNSSSWAVSPNAFSPNSDNWELVLNIKTGTIGTEQFLINCTPEGRHAVGLYIDTSGKLTFESYVNNTTTVLLRITGITTLSANTDYYAKIEYDSSNGYTLSLSTDGTTYTTEATSAITTPITSGQKLVFGVDNVEGGGYYNFAFTGTIDLNNSYININNSSWWSGVNTLNYTYNEANNKHRFYDIADKATFDNMYTITGEAWYYGIDTTNERIFLPRSTRFKNGTTNDVGGYQAAGLPNITASPTGIWRRTNANIPTIAEGATTIVQDTTHDYIAGSGATAEAVWVASFNASRSSQIYGSSNTVEYASTKLIPYMVVGNQASWSGMTDVVNQGMDILNQVSTGLATKIDLDGNNAQFPHIIEKYDNGNSWYKVWSDGWCEQGSRFETNSVTGSNISVAFLLSYQDTNISITHSQMGYISSAQANNAITAGTITTSGFGFTCGVVGNVTIIWEAKGYINL